MNKFFDDTYYRILVMITKRWLPTEARFNFATTQFGRCSLKIQEYKAHDFQVKCDEIKIALGEENFGYYWGNTKIGGLSWPNDPGVKTLNIFLPKEHDRELIIGYMRLNGLWIEDDQLY